MSDLKTVRNGYDKSQVAALIRQLIEQARAEKEAAVHAAVENREEELKKAFQTREEELRAAMNTAIQEAQKKAEQARSSQAQQMQEDSSVKKEMERLNQWVEKLTAAWNKQADYTKELDAELRKYLKREKEISEQEEAVKFRLQQTDTEAEEILKKAQVQADIWLEDARKKQKQIEAEASLQAESIIGSARQKANEILSGIEQEQSRIAQKKILAVRSIQADYLKTIGQVQSILEDLQVRSQAALRGEERKQPALE